MRVLVADADEAVRSIIATVVRREGHEVVTVSDGRAVLEAASALFPPDLIILDWMLPHASGIEVCRHIRSLKPEAPPYLVILTVLGEKGDVRTGLEAGADEYFVKPVRLRDLRGIVARAARVANGGRPSLRAPESAKLRIQQEGERSPAQPAHPFGFVLVSLDDPAGAGLAGVAEGLRGMLPEGGWMERWDETAWLVGLPGADRAAVERFADACVESVRRAGVGATASVGGVACADARPTDVRWIVAASTAAMYNARCAGGDAAFVIRGRASMLPVSPC